MTTAAIYSRKSQLGASDDAKSVTRQVEHARAYAAKKGWVVADEHVYVDDGISGAEFLKRPGFLRLMNVINPRAPFDVLIMSEESRLGRERRKTEYALAEIVEAGVRIFYYLEDREVRLDDATSSFIESVRLFASEMEREKARQRTYDAMARKAKALHVTGGKVYGYDNVDVLSPAEASDGRQRRLHVVRVINPQQADVVHRIFELYADGQGLKRIAHALNADRVPGPRGRGGTWAPSALQAILHRPLYRGEIVWNRTQKVTRRGTKAQRRRPESDWFIIPAPELRIIPEDLWQRVQARHDLHAVTIARSSDAGKLLGKVPRADMESAHLLTGLARCTECEGPIISLTRPHGGKRVAFYGCGHNYRRGAAVCQNNVHVREDVVDKALLQAISDVLDERLLDAAIERALDRLRRGQERSLDRRTTIERELSLIENRVRRCVDLLVDGEGAANDLRARIVSEKERKRVLTAELEALSSAATIANLDRARLRQDLRPRVGDTVTLLGKHTAQARQMLRKLLVAGPLDFTGVREHGRRCFRVTGRGSYVRMLPLTVVAPTGFEPVFQP